MLIMDDDSSVELSQGQMMRKQTLGSTRNQKKLIKMTTSKKIKTMATTTMTSLPILMVKKK